MLRLKSAQKSNRGAAGYSRWVNRPLGRRLAAGAYLTGLTPNQVSCLSATFTYAAIAVIAVVRPSWPMAVLVTLALVLGYALDSADGQVARLRGGGSIDGEWLDHVFDALKIATFHLAVAVSWYRFYGLAHPSLLLVPLAFSAVSSTFFFAITLSDFLRRVDRAKAGGSVVTTASLNPDERAGVLRSLVVLPNDYGLLCLLLVLLPVHDAFIVLYTALTVANLGFLVVGAARWLREMRALGA
ncbi:CDP-alcohol phosphatidyltransferase family protein [Jatrophihabitans endophyticus]|uniref:CDP-alcohol phosphatidyltransferase family protein n=1 Tax=Jatrophihabitans endophyticus TaxID=1206085 RepID=UPI0026EA2FA8|nr:CDP-alcohol phosphatidyltransferase family protein [Jatrophihabitans endophyticus]